MSELKAFDIVVSEEYYCEGIVKYRRAVYDKSEADKVIARHRYKRCLAMAKWCNRIFSITFGKERYWQKWNRRWLELANKFKEAK